MGLNSKNAKIVFASNNGHKLEEIRSLFPNFEILSLKDIGFDKEIIENGHSFEANARIKSESIFRFLHTFKEENPSYLILSDDSGICVEALNFAPGIHSARYSSQGTDKANLEKLLEELRDNPNRKAFFICVLCLILPNGTTHFFEGKIHGNLSEKVLGENGFGYDPIFVPLGGEKSFAQMSESEKNSLSHRGVAGKKCSEFLAQILS
ncbi:MAG: non-canonical purine NTP pyrophosphatase, RdgB/HAM1 family [Flavobacteriaceae bacterium]|nr:MAG: non-canonical purine NTP pyrophosphatase, RdgB/HAM1 family [Flavobacteriaceae bacterium]